MTLSAESALQRIGIEAFVGTKFGDINIPDSVRELSDRCFVECTHLYHVRISETSSLERIGVEAFRETNIPEIFKQGSGAL